MTTPADQLQALVEQANRLALSSDEPTWDTFVRSVGLTPLSAEQRAFIRASGVPKLKGMLPVELRVVLEAIRARFAPMADSESMKTDLLVLVDREMLRFVAAAQPPKSVLPGIFANAQRTAVRLGPQADSLSAQKCTCCGAARPAESNLRSCTFCGQSFFPPGAGRPA